MKRFLEDLGRGHTESYYGTIIESLTLKGAIPRATLGIWVHNIRSLIL